MNKIYDNLNKYGENVKGKFSHKPHENGIVISVTSPFVAEIHIECDNDISNYYWEPYSLLEPQANHPEGDHWKIYFNTQEKRYYRSEWSQLEESKKGYIWVLIDERFIVKHARKCEELQAHFRAYRNIHKGQFRAI